MYNSCLFILFAIFYDAVVCYFRAKSNSDSQPGNLTGVYNGTNGTVILSNEREFSLHFQIQEDPSNFDENDAAVLQPQEDENINVKVNESDIDSVQPPQDKKEKSAIVLQLQQNENKNDSAVEQPYQDIDKNEYDTVTVLGENENVNKPGAVVGELNPDQMKSVKDNDCYGKQAL